MRAEDEKGNAVRADVFVDGDRVGRAPGVFKESVCAPEFVLTAATSRDHVGRRRKKVGCIRSQTEGKIVQRTP